MHGRFQCHQFLWTRYCAIINFNPALSMDKVHESIDGRMILAKFTLLDNSIPPFYVLNLYAPAEPNSRTKTTFFNNMITMLHSLPDSAAILSSLIVAGDLNYSFDTSSSHYSVAHPCAPLLDFVQNNLHDCFTVPGEPLYDHTYNRGSTRSTIDYVFAGVDIYPHINDTHVGFIAPAWTGHALLSFTYTVGTSNVGKGTWRADPHLATNPAYVKKLNHELDQYVQNKLLATSSVQDHWDHIKRMVKKVTQNFCRFRAAKQTQLLRDLQSDRNSMLRNHRDDPMVLQNLLPDIDAQIARIQQTRAATASLRADRRWLEHNEQSAAYLARTSLIRNATRNFKKIIHPVSGVACEDTVSKLEAIHTFYSDLYTERNIDTQCLDHMLSFVHRQLSDSDVEAITAPITLNDLLEGSSRCPRKSSPGLDGLPYEILRLIIAHPRCQPIAQQVYNEAITLARFPQSWQQAVIALIPKKGDLSDLANWQPISLINTNCKVFTRLMNARLVPLASKLITEFQGGFMQQRFIGDHGLTNQLILENAQKTKEGGVEFMGVMLDQTKAYDLIHPVYLTKVLEKFGFPPAFVECIHSLFNNQIFVNMNGFLSTAVSQRRGLRQGDSISPLLFNFAIELFLQSILANPEISGYSLQQGNVPFATGLHYTAPHRSIKLLAYADDVLLYIQSVEEFQALERCLGVYNQASNSRINYNKSVAFPLTGVALTSPPGIQLQEYIVQTQRMRWFDSTSTGFLPYLGFPVWFTISQRDAFTSSMLQQIESALEPHTHRHLSFYGKATIANVLALTKLWHILRISPLLPKVFFQQVKTRVHRFLYGKMFPQMRSSIFYLPRNKGGLGIMDAAVQQQVFQFRYIKALVNDALSLPVAVPSFLVQLLSDSIQLTYGAPSAMLPLLFPDWRTARRPRLRSSFLSLLFQAVDAGFPRRDHGSIWPKIPSDYACLSLPVREVFYSNPHHPDPPFEFSKLLSSLTVSEFFLFDPTHQLLHYRSPAECAHPGLLRTIRTSITSFSLLAHRYMAFHLGLIPLPPSQSPADAVHQRQLINSSLFTIQPFISTFLTIDNRLISLCPNRTIRNQILRSQPPIDYGSSYNPRITSFRWLSFIHTPMAAGARNLWYRLLQQKLSNRSALALIPRIALNESDRCVFCNEVESIEHMLISCPHKQDIWRPMLSMYFINSAHFSLHRVYTDLCELTLSSYIFSPILPTISIIDFFSVVLYQVWRAHWRHHFDAVPLIPQHVFPAIHKELRILVKQQQL